MKIEIPSDPVILSLLLGTVSFIVSILVFALAKPDTVVKLNDDRKKVLDWFKIVIVSVMIYIGVSIASFLILVKDRVIEPVVMKNNNEENERNEIRTEQPSYRLPTTYGLTY